MKDMKDFRDFGYMIHDLSEESRALVKTARSTAWWRLAPGERLEDYHRKESGDITFHQAALREILRGYPRMIVEQELPLFRSLLGPDLHIQKLPYLRISRPGIVSDNIGMHRDTWYGDSPYELAVWIPLTNTCAGNTLQVMSGSHAWAEGEPHNREAQSEKGSVRHSLGFMYAPKEMKFDESLLRPLVVNVGQMIVFNLALLHGTEANISEETRISMDVRITNSYAPIKWQRSRGEHYEPLSKSPVTEQAERYAQANAA